MSRTSWRYKQRPMKLFWPINRRERNNKQKGRAVARSYFYRGCLVFIWRFSKKHNVR